MQSYLPKTFPQLKLEKPLFYSWSIGIRFEIGPTDTSLWKTKHEDLNHAYFEEALNRSVRIFNSVFSAEDEMIFVYQEFSSGKRRIKRNSYIFKCIDKNKHKYTKLTKVRNLYELEKKQYHWNRLSLTIHKDDIDYKRILKKIVYSDFGSGIRGECFFINKSQNTILNLYDDRGMDLITNHKENLEEIYKTYNSWILDYDRKNIDEVFK
jgi:hypothetical protein